MRVVLRYGANRRAVRAFEARQELVRAGLTRRDLAKLGLMTGGGVGGGLLLSEKSLARELRSTSALGSLPPLTPFVQALTVLPTLPQRAASELGPAPTNDPNTAPIDTNRTKRAYGLAGAPGLTPGGSPRNARRKDPRTTVEKINRLQRLACSTWRN